ncbi:MAG: tetratricopeptide repeat protein [Desulfobacterales bacterium]|nr:tetratricopeptide repeat protein [Desulfobacterales bacterium]
MANKSKTLCQIGETIGGRYWAYKALKGGMGEVYLCFDKTKKIPIALKTFQIRYFKNPKIHDIFKNEVRTWIGLGHHPNIVRCHSLEIIDNHPFMRMEWVFCKENAGTDLRSWLRGALKPRLALDFAIDICRGLIHANQKIPGIVHRDLKPENILIGEGQIAKITDFGLAQIAKAANLEIFAQNSESEHRQSIICSGNIAGTPPYMAPEQWQNSTLDVRTDIYAVGCILYEMLTGRRPFSALTVKGLSHQHTESPIPELKRHVSLPPDLDKIIACCLAKQKNDRFATADELLWKLSQVYQQQFDTEPRPIKIGQGLIVCNYIQRALTYLRLQEHDAALADISHAVKIDDGAEMPSILMVRASIYFETGRYDESLENINQSIEIAPEKALAYAVRADLHLMHTQHYDKALSDAKEAIELEPGFALAFVSRGCVYSYLNQLDKALSDINRAIELDAECETAYIVRADIYNAMCLYNNSLNDLNKVTNLIPIPYIGKHLTFLFHLSRGTAYLGLQRFKEALTDLNQALEFSSNILPFLTALAYLNRGATYIELQRFKEGLADLNKAAEFISVILPIQAALIYLNRGIAYARMQCFEDALIDLNQAAEFISDIPLPQAALLYLNRGHTYYELKRFEEALINLNQAVERISDIPSSQAALAYLNRGAAYIGLNRSQEALADLDQAVELISDMPQVALAYLNRGAAYLGLNRSQEALVDLNQAVERISYMNSSHAALTYSNRGLAYMNLKRNDKAIADFKLAFKLNSDIPQAHFNMGLLLADQGEIQEALSCFEKAVQLGLPQAALFTDFYDNNFFQKMRGARRFQIEYFSGRKRVDLWTCLYIPAHSLNFNEDKFLNLLIGSVSLTIVEKAGVIASIPKLSQEQIDELFHILTEERIKHCNLNPEHFDQLDEIQDRYINDWREWEINSNKLTGS